MDRLIGWVDRGQGRFRLRFGNTYGGTVGLVSVLGRQDDRIFSVVLRLRAPSLRPLRFPFLGNFLLLVVVVHSIYHLL
jgi:hypothetical protein